MPKPVACPRCRGQIRSTATYEREIFAIENADPLFPWRRPDTTFTNAARKTGKRTWTVECTACHAQWGSITAFNREWLAAGAPKL